MDPAQILDALQQAAPYIVALLVASTALAHVAQRAARAFERYAKSTQDTRDDAIAHKLVKAADAVAGALDFVARFLPRVGLGPKDDPHA